MADHTHDDSVEQHAAPTESALENYTGSELPYRALYISGIALFVTAVVFAVALIPLRDAFIASSDKQSEGTLVPSPERPTMSRLQQSPEGDWKVWEAIMSDRLSSYGWQDEARGIARIPVDRAVALALEEGLIQSTPDAVAAVLPAATSEHGTQQHGAQQHDTEQHATDDHASTPEEHSSEEASH